MKPDVGGFCTIPEFWALPQNLWVLPDESSSVPTRQQMATAPSHCSGLRERCEEGGGLPKLLDFFFSTTARFARNFWVAGEARARNGPSEFERIFQRGIAVLPHASDRWVVVEGFIEHVLSEGSCGFLPRKFRALWRIPECWFLYCSFLLKTPVTLLCWRIACGSVLGLFVFFSHGVFVGWLWRSGRLSLRSGASSSSNY